MYMTYFKPRIYRAVNTGALRFDIMKFCCICIQIYALIYVYQLHSVGHGYEVLAMQRYQQLQRLPSNTPVNVPQETPRNVPGDLSMSPIPVLSVDQCHRDVMRC